eukprot:c3604_g1_i1.p1 GENE.c3604_g1_i1~~c3604_g1_i1.p1  ORF type:complete len:591 (-),score=73.59 c3604_g1_i1:82-1854(-)
MGVKEMLAGRGGAFRTPSRQPHITKPSLSTSPLLISSFCFKDIINKHKSQTAQEQRFMTDSNGRFQLVQHTETKLSTIEEAAPISHRFLILALIGAGTCANVFRARDLFRPDSPLVAVKVFNSSFSTVGEQEAALLHRYHTLCPSTSFCMSSARSCFLVNTETRSHFCIALELLQPLHLSSALSSPSKQSSPDPPSKPPALSIDQVTKVCQNVLVALIALHASNIIHADVKPDNVMQTSRGEVKLIDLSNVLQRADWVILSEDSFEVQTLSFRAPEVILGLALTPAIDMWSLGCLCIELATGWRVFESTSARQLLYRITDLLGQLPTQLSQGLLYSKYFSADHHLLGVKSGPSDSSSVLCLSARALRLRRRLLARGFDSVARDAHLIDFIARLLEPNHQTRMTAAQAITHPLLHTTSPLFSLTHLPCTATTNTSLISALRFNSPLPSPPDVKTEPAEPLRPATKHEQPTLNETHHPPEELRRIRSPVSASPGIRANDFEPQEDQLRPVPEQKTPSTPSPRKLSLRSSRSSSNQDDDELTPNSRKLRPRKRLRVDTSAAVPEVEHSSTIATAFSILMRRKRQAMMRGEAEQ